ncbi:hypothetical protein EON65_10190 [archaeon]|nr:MAG: hypothetical protein EON65_10190 [archaeon]
MDECRLSVGLAEKIIKLRLVRFANQVYFSLNSRLPLIPFAPPNKEQHFMSKMWKLRSRFLIGGGMGETKVEHISLAGERGHPSHFFFTGLGFFSSTFA